MQTRYFYDFFAFVYFETVSSSPDIRHAIPSWTRAKYTIGRSIGLSRFYPRDIFLNEYELACNLCGSGRRRQAGWHFVSLFIRPIGISGILKKEKNLGIVERNLLFLSFLVSQALNLLFAEP